MNERTKEKNPHPKSGDKHETRVVNSTQILAAMKEKLIIEKFYEREIKVSIDKFVIRSKPLLKLNVLYEIERCLNPWPYSFSIQEKKLKKNGKVSEDTTISEFLRGYTGNGLETYEDKISQNIENFVTKVINNGVMYAIEDLGYDATSSIIQKIIVLYKKDNDILLSVYGIAKFCEIENAGLKMIQELRKE